MLGSKVFSKQISVTDISCLVGEGFCWSKMTCATPCLTHENVMFRRFLLEQDDVDLNAVDSEGNTPLHLALESGQEVVSMLLMQHGADVTASNSFGRTPLHFASLQGMEQVRPQPSPTFAGMVIGRTWGCGSDKQFWVVDQINSLAQLKCDSDTSS